MSKVAPPKEVNGRLKWEPIQEAELKRIVTEFNCPSGSAAKEKLGPLWKSVSAKKITRKMDSLGIRPTSSKRLYTTLRLLIYCFQKSSPWTPW